MLEGWRMKMTTRFLRLPVNQLQLPADLHLPAEAVGLVVFVHGSGSGRLSPRNQQVAGYFNQRHLATLLFDLLSEPEQSFDQLTHALRFDIPLLSQRLIAVLDWLSHEPDLTHFAFGLFGASTGAAAALFAAAERPQRVRALVCRGGRSDLAQAAAPRVRAPVLQLVGERDPAVLELNRQTSRSLRCEQQIVVIANATHLFEEPGALDAVAKYSADWFCRHLGVAA